MPTNNVSGKQEKNRSWTSKFSPSLIHFQLWQYHVFTIIKFEEQSNQLISLKMCYLNPIKLASFMSKLRALMPIIVEFIEIELQEQNRRV